MKICNFDLIILVILMFIVNFFYDTIKNTLMLKKALIHSQMLKQQ